MMSHIGNAYDVDMKYYYNRKSKYFQDLCHRGNTTRTITIQQFLKFLSFAYLSDTSSQDDDFDFHMNTDCLRVTRVNIFSELVDIDEDCLYSVINECDNVGDMRLTNEHDLFNYSDYFLSIPSCTTLITYSDTSKESLTSILEEPVPFQIENNELVHVTSSISIAGKQISESALPKSKNNSTFEKINTQINSLSGEKSGTLFHNFFNKNLGNVCTAKFASPTESNHSRDDMNDQIRARNQSFSTDHMIKILADKNTKFFKDRILTIRVKDHRKKVAKDFQISKELLLSKMGYFADKNLKNAKINVHCDLNIFKWIMEWLFNCESSKSEHLLNSKTVIQCLVSVSLLRIEELINVCLHYCKNNMNEVIQSTKNFSCLGDNIIDRLANLFSNVEVEALKDEKDRIRSILYCQLILSLSLPEPEPWKGHFSSLTSVFKCTHCNKLVMYKIANLIPCLQDNIQLNLNGEISIIHASDPNWNLTEYIGNLKKELKSWRKVYWRLWAECHYLFCTECKFYYSVYNYNKCLYHPKEPQFSEGKQADSSTGYYPCCGSKSYQYECVVHYGRGCKTKNHSPELKYNRISTDIMKLLQRFHEFIFSTKTNDSNTICDDVVIGKPLQTLSKCNNNVHLKLPYFTSKDEKGILGHKLCKTKENGGNVHQCWIPDANISKYPAKTSSSIGLLSNDKKPRSTLVGLLMQLESFENGTNVSETSLSSFNSDSEVESDYECESSGEDSFDMANSDNDVHKLNYWKTDKMKSKRIKTSERYTTRINQDNQRECERCTLVLANSYLTHKKHRKNSFTCFNNNIFTSCASTSVMSSSSQSSICSITRLQTPLIWGTHTPFSGTYKRIESEWIKGTKCIANTPANVCSIHHTKMCSHCKEQATIKNSPQAVSRRLKLQAPQSSFQGDVKKKLSFDLRSHHLDYHSAVYKPISTWKEYKLEKYRLHVDWPYLLAVEQKWRSFLKLLDENELSTFENT